MFTKLKNFRNESFKEEGFTLIELLIVIVIIGFLAALAIPIFSNQQKGASIAAVQHDVRNVANVATTYLSQTGTYPETCDEWGELFPDDWRSDVTETISVKTADGGMNLWIEAIPKATGVSAGIHLSELELDKSIVIFDTSSNGGITNRHSYMNEFDLDDREHVSFDAGYTGIGFIVSNVGDCEVWS